MIYLAYYTQHGTECCNTFVKYIAFCTNCVRALGCRSRWLWWCTVDTVDAAAAATVAVDKLAPSLAAGSLPCICTETGAHTSTL